MAEYLTFKDKYAESEGQSFWVKTFKNAFMYKFSDGKIKLCVWDGEAGEFGEVSEDYSTENVKYLKGGNRCFRIALDNNLKLFDDNMSNYNCGVGQNSTKKHISFGNPFVYKIGSDNYLVCELKPFSTSVNIDNINKCCVEMFGDAINRTYYEYYWNFVDGSVDTTYEKYVLEESLMLNYKEPFKVLYWANGCRIDKYKEEDSSYVVDRYF